MSQRLFLDADTVLKSFSHNYNFEDFQKSEMVLTESKDDHFLYKIYSTIRGDTLIILKEEKIRINIKWK